MAEPFKTFTRDSLQDILNMLPVAVMVFNPNLYVILANNAALIFTRKTGDQILGHSGAEVLGCTNRHENARGCGFGLNCSSCYLRAALTRTVETGQPQARIEAAMDLDAKGNRLLRLSTFPLTLEKDTAILLTIEDLTQARRYEQEHLEKEKLSAVLETTGGISHELSQPLQVIMGYNEILSCRSDLDEEIENALAAIDQATQKLSRLTHSLTHITQFKTKPYLTSNIIDLEHSAAPKKT